MSEFHLKCLAFGFMIGVCWLIIDQIFINIFGKPEDGEDEDE